MSGRLLVILLAGLAIGALLAWLLVAGSEQVAPVEEIITAEPIPTPTPAPEQRITLFFAGEDGLLHPEIRTVPLPDETSARIRIVFADLLAGSTQGFQAVLPYPAELRTVFVSTDGRAYVDLTGPPEPLDGSATELMLVYGIVNSILLNTEVQAVQVLFDGSERATLTGHLDLSRPLVLNKHFIGAS